ncbi:hypothetical protein BBO99_00003584 [Phytophthora kernoviae]|uniref:Dihydrolipoamide acetyltransferase component of pyruvate dehydrogenase complex n=2 Tax=Phytophthora kernoviae TaxID=325452 RepID=A0A421GTH9_9STRA|nr:hypothetical protein G195_005952 [Phytophthora kernoviae 00238/432]KAG2529087.1 hypothetical protein JM18_002929 [Phytophthora kernoviae]RLN27320.1 hypothetical protein BBI17_003743 [Phytophthora kernoviae]RLN81592.1 hypothetical protein BBO99_00003584 [Phytophthora kernoviae]
MLPTGTKRRRCVVLEDGTAVGCYQRGVHETHTVVLEPSGHAYSYLQPDGTRSRHLTPTALSSHRSMVVDILNFRNKFTAQQPYLHLRLMNPKDVRLQRRIRSPRARWPAPGSNGGKLKVSRLHNPQERCFEMQSIEGAAKAQLHTNGKLVELFYLVEVKVSDEDVDDESRHAHYATLRQSFAIEQVPECFQLPVNILLAAKTAWDKDREAEIDYVAMDKDKGSTVVQLNDQHSLLTGCDGFFTWFDEAGRRQHQFTRETIPPSSTIDAKNTGHSILELCQHIDYVLQAFKYATQTFTNDPKLPSPMETEQLELVEEVENERGRFRAFRDGRVRVAFEDRTILQVQRDGECCSFFFPDGSTGRTTLASAPLQLRTYIYQALEFGDWAFASQEERMGLHLKRQEAQAIASRELQRISVRCGMNRELERRQRGAERRVTPLLRRAFSAALPEGVMPLTMPSLSPTMETGSLSSWLKKEGEEISAGDVLCQVETDKAVVDYEMQDDAVVAKIVCSEGTADLPIGALLCYTVEDVETYQSLLASGELARLSAESVAEVAAPAPAAAAPVETTATDAEQTHGRVPLIKFLGKRALISEFNHSPLEEPVKAVAAAPAAPVAAAAPAPAADAEYEDLPLSNMRKIIAKRLTQSKQDVPHYYTNIDCEIDSILKFRKQLKNKHDVKVGMNDFILKAVALALRDVPEANCYFDVKTQSVKPNPSVDVSVAVATPSGLITPIVPKVDALGLSGVNRIFMELVQRARQNKLKPEEFQGGSFTVSNLGSFGIDQFRAVINPPQACILAIGGGRKEVLPPLEIVEGVNPEPRLATLMNVTLSSDRRVVDSVIAGQFLQVFKSYMESPELMVL